MSIPQSTDVADVAVVAGPSFSDLALSPEVLRALTDVGYESPSPIQAATIPHLLAGSDVLGQAQTGTGKTAAFALPILSKIDLNRKTPQPQALVLAPTRELAIQVAEAFQRYAKHLPGFHVLPIYGGQAYGPQLSALKRGVHVVVGTPGRVMDHMQRGTLKLDRIDCLVLDEADEMLRMGFIDDVETILQQTPPTRQVALFSATMPSAIRRIAQTHLKTPAEVTIKSKTSTATNIRQRYWLVSGTNKLDALTRILEAEQFDGMLIFARTKAGTVELAERLEARGYNVAALNGDMEQKQRERTVARLKDGQLDIVVATDIAARGLDVERISHVFNYDVPTDTESYVHRIGRTGRAGRSGEAILFISPRERHLLRAIERATRQPITPMELPSADAVNDQRVVRFKQKITSALEASDIGPFRELIEQYEKEHNVPAIEIAAALARLVQGDRPLLLKTNAGGGVPVTEKARQAFSESVAAAPRSPSPRHAPAAPSRSAYEPAPRTEEGAAPSFRPADDSEAERPRPKRSKSSDEEVPKETFRIEVGSTHGVKPGNIVGAIANEAGIDSEYIGRIDIREDHSFIDLPTGMPKKIFKDLQKVWVSGRQLRITRKDQSTPYSEPPPKHGKPKHKPRS
ncbi:DEAD/DEAH box helicase [Nevskia soli]|uniref:DEAD/DEAH box helicase n=1 Tax=Nevskia soli TaxID=418856 RepID=UPI0006920809|nr:DEAD/DEAH box helicase [Nevskia soli]